jgi:hypothetical protein
MAAANPFSVPPIANPRDAFTITVSTPTINHLLHSVDAALTAAEGGVIALIGGYGAGKTHIAGELLRRVGDLPRPVYLESGGDALGLYRGFVRELGLDAIREAVQAHLRDAVTEVLAGSDVTTPIAELVHTGTMDVGRVVRELRLSESTILEGVKDTVASLVQDAEFAQVVTLLLRPGFDGAVYEWISGGPPGEVLADRGVTHAIAGETSALDALGRLLLLCGRGRVLVIDEMNRFALDAPGTVDALRKLFEVATRAGTILVLAGGPEFLGALPGDVQQRLRLTLKVVPLTAAQVAEFVRISQQDHLPVLDSGDPVLMGQLASVTNGNPRHLIRLCHQLYRRTEPVTPAGVAQVALDLFRDAGTDHVRAEVGRTLRAHDLPFVHDHDLADFWIPAGHTGCALVVVEGVFDPVTCEDVVDRGKRIRAMVSSPTALLIVACAVLPDEYHEVLAAAYGSEPLRYDYQSFDSDLSAAVEAMTGPRPATAAHVDAVAAFAVPQAEPAVLLDALGHAYDELCEWIRPGSLPDRSRSLSEELRTAVRRRR